MLIILGLYTAPLPMTTTATALILLLAWLILWLSLEVFKGHHDAGQLRPMTMFLVLLAFSLASAMARLESCAGQRL